LLFEAEGATRGVGVHHEDEVEEGGFADGGHRRAWVGSHSGLKK
jgi:hypothetical protein